MKKFTHFILAFLIICAFTLLLVELVFRWFVFHPGSVYQQIYEAITLPDAQVGYLSQPYLNYINRPGYKDTLGNVEINRLGLRYPRDISLQKPDSTLRILFLGGSTTFGDVDDSFEVFPALIEKDLRTFFLPASKKYREVECLNGGVHGLTSAELLTHFQFKYQYLQPDWLVLHTGFNDAFMYAGINNAPYQPDYHNSRRVYRDVMELTPLERKLLWSKAVVYAIVQLRLSDYLKTSLEDNVFFHFTNDNLWFESGKATYTDTLYSAFYQNLRTLCEVAHRRGAKVLLVPEVCDTTKMPPQLRMPLLAGLMRHKQMMQTIANEHNSFYRLLPDSVFTPDMFLDDDGIHVNDKGEKLKAGYIAQYLKMLFTE